MCSTRASPPVAPRGRERGGGTGAEQEHAAVYPAQWTRAEGRRRRRGGVSAHGSCGRSGTTPQHALHHRPRVGSPVTGGGWSLVTGPHPARGTMHMLATDATAARATRRSQATARRHVAAGIAPSPRLLRLPRVGLRKGVRAARGATIPPPSPALLQHGPNRGNRAAEAAAEAQHGPPRVCAPSTRPRGLSPGGSPR